jgi:hypothetical protein
MVWPRQPGVVLALGGQGLLVSMRVPVLMPGRCGRVPSDRIGGLPNVRASASSGVGTA